MTGDDNRSGNATYSAPALDRGTNQIGVRLYNERLALSLIRRHGSLPKADIARLTGLSAQTISVIMKQLEADGFVVKQKPRRGRIGQPSVPFALAPGAAYSLGLKIGRRSSDLVLVDFLGGILMLRHVTYPYPTPAGILQSVRSGLAQVEETLSAEQRRRITGIGIATPFELWNWHEEMGAPQSALNAWRDFDIEASIEAIAPWPVHLCNDATAACAAELTFGIGHRYQDYLYVFIGSFIGGGVVLNGTLFPGRTGNAGALGSLPVPANGEAGRTLTRQLIATASIHVLEKRLLAAGQDPTPLWRSPDDWGDNGPLIEQWVQDVADQLAIAITAAISVIDFGTVIIDGAVPAAIRTAIVERTKAASARIDRQGLSPTDVVEGTIGSVARALGAASLPLLANFARDSDVLFKEAV